MRVFARGERPHPGAQLTLFETADGWRYTLHARTCPRTRRAGAASAAYIDAGHRVHVRVEDVVSSRQCGGKSFAAVTAAVGR
jgi:hypothetical protein